MLPEKPFGEYPCLSMRKEFIVNMKSATRIVTLIAKAESNGSLDKKK